MVVFVQEFDVEHFGEVLAELMGGGGLDGSVVSWNICLDGGGVKSAWELLSFGLGLNLSEIHNFLLP